MEPKTAIETTIRWNKPEDIAPPFDKEILVLVGGQEYNNGVWRKYLKPMEVRVSKEGPSDDASESQFDYGDFVSTKRVFMDCQFYLNELNSDSDDLCDWFSDSIVLWAESPLSELNRLLEASE